MATEKIYVLRAVPKTKAEEPTYEVQLWQGDSPRRVQQVAMREAKAWEVPRTILALIADREEECVGPWPYLGEPLPDGAKSDYTCLFVPKAFAKTEEQVRNEDSVFFIDPDSPELEIIEVTDFELVDQGR